MRLTRALLLAVILGLGPASSSQGATPSKDELVEWLTDQLQQAREYPPIEGLYVEYVVETHYPMDPGELDQLAREIGDKVDHPRWAELELHRRYAENGPSVEEKRIWVKKEGAFRYSQDRDDEFMPYHDLAVVDKYAWQMTNRQIYLVDPRKGFPENLNFLMYESGGFSYDLKILFSGGLSTLSLGPVDTEDVNLSGDVFEAVMGLDSEASAEVQGFWSDAENRWFIDQIMFLTAANPDFTGRRIIVDNWTEDPIAGEWIAARADELNPDGSLRRVIRLGEMRVMDSEEFEEVSAIPELAGQDPVRGAMEATSLRDHRPSTPVAYMLEDHGDASSTSAQPIQDARSTTSRAISVRTWQILGWSTAGVLLLLALALRGRFGK